MKKAKLKFWVWFLKRFEWHDKFTASKVRHHKREISFWGQVAEKLRANNG